MAVVRESYGQGRKIQYVQSPVDITWDFPLHEQLEPQLSGGPDPAKTQTDLRAIRRQIPKMTEQNFKDIFPGDEQSTITVVLQNYSRHYVQLQEAATWILNAVQWFSVLEQPMVVVIRCRDWEDAAKFQYMMQILQVNLQASRSGRSLSKDSKRSIRRSNNGNFQQRSGQVLQYWASCQRQTSITSKLLASSFSIQCGRFQAHQLPRIGIQSHSECQPTISKTIQDMRKML